MEVVKMDYKTLRNNRAFVTGILTSAINQMIKQGIPKDKVIDYYKDILENMKNEKLFDEV
jgi:DNA-binding transcriptional regulator YhcF (GntR family)